MFLNFFTHNFYQRPECKLCKRPHTYYRNDPSIRVDCPETTEHYFVHPDCLVMFNCFVCDKNFLRPPCASVTQEGLKLYHDDCYISDYTCVFCENIVEDDDSMMTGNGTAVCHTTCFRANVRHCIACTNPVESSDHVFILGPNAIAHIKCTFKCSRCFSRGIVSTPHSKELLCYARSCDNETNFCSTKDKCPCGKPLHNGFDSQQPLGCQKFFCQGVMHNFFDLFHLKTGFTSDGCTRPDMSNIKVHNVCTGIASSKFGKKGDIEEILEKIKNHTKQEAGEDQDLEDLFLQLMVKMISHMVATQ